MWPAAFLFFGMAEINVGSHYGALEWCVPQRLNLPVERGSHLKFAKFICCISSSSVVNFQLSENSGCEELLETTRTI